MDPHSPPQVGLSALFPYLRAHAVALATAATLSLLAAVAALAQPALIRVVLDRIGTPDPVAGYVGLLVGLLVGGAAVSAGRDYLLQRSAEGLVLTARRCLAHRLLRLPIAEYDRRRTGDLLSRVGADTTLLRAVVTSGLLDLAGGLLVVVGAAVMMVLLDPLMFAVTLVCLVGISTAVLIARRVRGASEHAQAQLGSMTSAVERAISAVRTIRAASAEDRETAVIVADAYGVYRAGLRIAKLMALVGPSVAVAVHGAFLAVLGIGGSRVASGAVSVGELVAFVLLLFLLMMPVGQAMNAYTQLQAGLGALQRIQEILAIPTETDGERPAAADADSAVLAPAVALDRVSFAYDGGPSVLRDVSFTVPYGTMTALVGPSGAGKSTLLALIERFYDAGTGSVRVGGADVRELSRRELRAQLGYVEQEAHVLAGTIRSNLLLASPTATDAELLAALEQVNLTEVVDRTPVGLDAYVGESGVLLSGGERQRLAIARALLASAPILLLDEPTSSLDSRNENALRHAIDVVSQRRTLIVVAHRLSTVADADQIVVLDRGRVVAVGRHDDLTQSCSLYRELATQQLLVV